MSCRCGLALAFGGLVPFMDKDMVTSSWKAALRDAGDTSAHDALAVVESGAAAGGDHPEAGAADHSAGGADKGGVGGSGADMASSSSASPGDVDLQSSSSLKSIGSGNGAGGVGPTLTCSTVEEALRFRGEFVAAMAQNMGGLEYSSGYEMSTSQELTALATLQGWSKEEEQLLLARLNTRCRGDQAVLVQEEGSFGADNAAAAGAGAPESESAEAVPASSWVDAWDESEGGMTWVDAHRWLLCLDSAVDALCWQDTIRQASFSVHAVLAAEASRHRIRNRLQELLQVCTLFFFFSDQFLSD